MKAVIILAVLAVFVAAAEASCMSKTGLKPTGYLLLHNGHTCRCMPAGRFLCRKGLSLDEAEGCNVEEYTYPVGQFNLDSNTCECEEGGKFSCEPAALAEVAASEDKELSKRLMEVLAGLEK